ncbi:MAG TPA: tetratricopeptide repeat protein [Myxococcaceae bacterium]|nr:tetratricopeptide repeat protein [Myxococcaceae bacterium]
MRRFAVAFALSAALCARAEENPLLTEAKASYRALDYEGCVARLRRASRLPLSRDEETGIALYEGLCLFYLGRPSAAQEAFERALSLDPRAQLPDLTSPKIAAFFEQIAARRAPSPESPPAPTPVEEPRSQSAVPADSPVQPPLAPGLAPADAPPEAVDLRAQPEPPSGRWVAPALGGLSALALAAGIVLGVQAKHWEGLANDPTGFESNGYRYDRAAKNSAVAANACYGLAATAAVSGALAWWLQHRSDGGR